MNAMLTALRRSFRHGVHPRTYKEQTQDLPIRPMPWVERYILPLHQHIGKPALCRVQPGQRIWRGQLLAEPDGFMSAAVHSPVTGWVRAITSCLYPDGRRMPAIEIKIDPHVIQALPAVSAVDWRALSAQQFVDRVQRCGLVGLGGAAFPSHIKYAPAPGKHLRHLVVNGAECEPYLTCDYRQMVERPEALLQGAEILRQRLNLEQVSIGLESNKRQAMRRLQEHIRPDRPVRLVSLRVKYPQGAEKMLLKAVLGLELPLGKRPADFGVLVNNVSTLIALADYFTRGTPLIERVVTVAGSGVERPANLRVPIGTPVREVLAVCGVTPGKDLSVLMGGPMMGMPLPHLEMPVVKGCTSLLVFDAAALGTLKTYACIRCGRCLQACPLFLNPSQLLRLANAQHHQGLADHHALECMECGSCSFVCPSGIPLVHHIRAAKASLRSAGSS